MKKISDHLIALGYLYVDTLNKLASDKLLKFNTEAALGPATASIERTSL